MHASILSLNDNRSKTESGPQITGYKKYSDAGMTRGRNGVMQE